MQRGTSANFDGCFFYEKFYAILDDDTSSYYVVRKMSVRVILFFQDCIDNNIFLKLLRSRYNFSGKNHSN